MRRLRPRLFKAEPTGLRRVSARDREIAALSATTPHTEVAARYGINAKTVANIASKVREADYDARLAKAM